MKIITITSGKLDQRTMKQVIAIIAPVFIIGMMIPIFRTLGKLLGDNLGWYLGLVLYWILWGGIYSCLMIGPEGIRKITRPHRLTLKNFLYIMVLVSLALTFKIMTGTEYHKPGLWILIMVLSTNLGNGFFEEILWRGVYMELFPSSIFMRIIWSSLWFALWHYAPGLVSSNGNTLGLMIGSGFMGLYLSILAKKTDTIWWGIIAHALGGLIMVL